MEDFEKAILNIVCLKTVRCKLTLDSENRSKSILVYNYYLYLYKAFIPQVEATLPVY